MATKFLYIIALISVFAIHGFAQNAQFPNELKGFEFFSTGKLKDLKLGKSKSADVIQIFGGNCRGYCDYDENFSISFTYLSAIDDCMTTKDIRDRAMCPQNEFVGTVSSVKLKPKSSIEIKSLSTSIFKILSSGGSTPKGGGPSTYWDSYTDVYGLTISLGKQTGTYTAYSHPLPFAEGKLDSINYVLSMISSARSSPSNTW